MNLLLGGGGAYVRDKIPQQDFVLKMQGGLMCEGSVFLGHYSKCNVVVVKRCEGVKV